MKVPAAAISPFFTLKVFAELESTNKTAQLLAVNGSPQGTIVQALRQTKGRGRLGKTWESPEGNLYFSVILRPNILPIEVSQLSFVAAIALRDALVKVLSKSSPINLKWPNDVLVRGKKIAGILLESSQKSSSAAIDWVILGIGVNVAQLPESISNATSILAEGRVLDIHSALVQICQTFEDTYSIWQTQGFSFIRERWLIFSYPIGTKISVSIDGALVSGFFSGLCDDGSLRLHVEGIGEKVVRGGEVDVCSSTH